LFYVCHVAGPYGLVVENGSYKNLRLLLLCCLSTFNAVNLFLFCVPCKG
jgi:hypothetical protein